METSDLRKQCIIQSSKLIINLDISITIVIIEGRITIEQLIKDKRFIQR